MCSCFLHVATCFGLRLCLFNSLLIVESCQKIRESSNPSFRMPEEDMLCYHFESISIYFSFT